MNFRLKSIIISAIFVLGFLNYAVYLKEDIKQDGKTMLLKLAPPKPFYLQHSSYMDLRYAIEPSISKQYGAVISIDAQGFGQCTSLYTGQDLAKNEIILPYSVRNNTVQIVPDEFNFLPKEHLEYYNKAEYAMFKYNDVGHILFIGLADTTGKEIIPPRIPDTESEANRFNWHEGKFREDKQYEPLMEHGSTMLLPITIVAPKGYQLPTLTKFTYTIDFKIATKLIEGYSEQGQAVIRLDAQNIGHFERLYKGEKILENEALVSYFVHDANVLFLPHDDIFITPNTFFFQEGHTKYYENAQYAVFKYNELGNNLLIGLADKSGEIIEPPKDNETTPSHESIVP